MKNNSLANFSRQNGYVPLAWAGSTTTMDYLNIGDALSPVMVALMSGLDVRRVPTKSQSLRMGCVGTVGHGFSGGEVHFWGTGSSPWSNPSAAAEERKPFVIEPDWNFIVHATRGPVSEKLLTGKAEGTVGVYGDPVWLLPRFYAPKIEKKWKLGVIVHLSELSDRATEAHVREELVRYHIPDELKDDIHIINTVSDIRVGAIGENIDEMLACERLVSTSLHGMVFAESYGIPCLHFGHPVQNNGLQDRSLADGSPIDLRVIDLYRGLGMSSLPIYGQSATEKTDWHALMAAVDAAWKPKTIDEQALIDAFPVDYNPISARPGETIWEHPVLTGLILQHDVAELRRSDKKK
jgi:hypothetical protein